MISWRASPYFVGRTKLSTGGPTPSQSEIYTCALLSGNVLFWAWLRSGSGNRVPYFSSLNEEHYVWWSPGWRLIEGVAIRTSLVTDKYAAILCTGFPVSTDFSLSGIADFVSHVVEFKKFRLLDSAALSLAYVASGRADAYMERDIKIWDVAAGAALVKAAEGTIVLTRKTRVRPRHSD